MQLMMWLTSVILKQHTQIVIVAVSRNFITLKKKSGVYYCQRERVVPLGSTLKFVMQLIL